MRNSLPVLRRAEAVPCHHAALWAEAAKRIARHRALRAGKGFESRDCYTDLPKAETSGFQTVLLECMSNLLANEMFRKSAVWEGLPERLTQEVMELAGRVPNLVVVSNDIFEDGVRYAGKPKFTGICWGKSIELWQTAPNRLPKLSAGFLSNGSRLYSIGWRERKRSDE